MRDRSLSEFNYVVERPDCMLGYNLRTGVFLLLDKVSVAVLRGERPLSDLSEEVQSILQNNGFVVTENERQSLNEQLQSTLRNKGTHLVLTPTIACNFRCDYCFQNEMRSSYVMGGDVASGVVAFVQAQLRNDCPPTKITWFGGEPLLAIDLIEQMSVRLHEAYASASRVLPYMDIITNGTLLSEFNCGRLRSAGVSKIQVSFDSLYFEKPNFRGVLNPDKSPSIISVNALAAVRAGMEVSARVNVDSRNFNQLDAIKTALMDLGLGRNTYFARVEHDHQEIYPHAVKPHRRLPIKVIAEPGIASGSLSREQYAKREREILFNQQNFPILLRKLAPRTHFCGATDGSMLVVSPNGGISRCWNSAGRQQEEICNILDPGAYETVFGSESAVNSAWDNFSPFDYQTCHQCKVLPICMGGCSHPRTMAGKSDPPCTSVKYYVDDLVRYVGEHLNVEGHKR